MSEYRDMPRARKLSRRRSLTMAWVFLIVAVSLISDKNVPACLSGLPVLGDWRKVRLRRRGMCQDWLVLFCCRCCPVRASDWSLACSLASYWLISFRGRAGACKLTQVCSAFHQITAGAGRESRSQLRLKTCFAWSNFISIWKYKIHEKRGFSRILGVTCKVVRSWILKCTFSLAILFALISHLLG